MLSVGKRTIRKTSKEGGLLLPLIHLQQSFHKPDNLFSVFFAKFWKFLHKLLFNPIHCHSIVQSKAGLFGDPEGKEMQGKFFKAGHGG
jgi:hypothetical protein